jgi:D-alanyl-D-alanine carboxypeptidase/D-alanyl-D-alanine-endopeptidase (penicillin-binding protein 4)
LGGCTSPPLSQIVREMMKRSQNLYAQLLLLQTGAQPGAFAGATTEERGVNRLEEFASRIGIKPGELLLDDGAGLSRSALVTPDAFIRLLRFMSKSAEFRASLPEAGTDGTLRNRLPELKGRLWAKTGTIRFVDTLSGYLTTSTGEPVAFSIMLNAYAPPRGHGSREEIDAAVRLLAQLGERSADK